mgnify:CR=1 FL=1
MLEQLSADEEAQREAYRAKAKTLSARRRKKAGAFTKAIDLNMHALGIKEGELSVVFHEQEGEFGLEQIEFHVRTNKRFDAGPLNKIASGGEQTRINLAIQIVAAQRSERVQQLGRIHHRLFLLLRIRTRRWCRLPTVGYGWIWQRSSRRPLILREPIRYT